MSRVCSFANCFEGFRFLRWPFGISLISDVFQKTLSEIFDSLSGVPVYVEHVLVWRAPREQHNLPLKAMFQDGKQAESTLNPEKCIIDVYEIEVLGDTISRDSTKPKSALIKCIEQMPNRFDKLGVQRLVGVVNYFFR